MALKLTINDGIEKPFYLGSLMENKTNENEIDEKDEFVEQDETNKVSKKYCEVIKKQKKLNITPENIGEILLCQIPNISSVTAIAVLKKFKTIVNLIDSLKIDENCLNDISYETIKGKERKIGKNCINNIIKYLKK
jgi:transcriptional regulator NrdR family protein